MYSHLSTLRLFSPKILIPISKPLTLRPPSHPIFFPTSRPITFQPLPDLQSYTAVKSLLQSSSSSPTQADPGTLPPNLQKIVALFQSVPDPKSKYQQLLHYGTQLPPFPPQFKNDDHRVRGCVSQVWVRAYPDPSDPSLVRFDADSDSQLTKGLAALLVLGLSGETPAAISSVSPDFVHLLGLRQSLTPSRSNGFINMLKLMQEKARQIGGLSLDVKDEVLVAEGRGTGVNSDVGAKMQAKEEVTSENYEEEVMSVNCEENDGFKKVEEVAISGNGRGRNERIREKLERELSPVALDLEDISHMHSGHAGVQGNSGGETHFNLRVVSDKFEGKSLVKRHRLIYDLLREELESGLHALSIVAKTPSEV